MVDISYSRAIYSTTTIAEDFNKTVTMVVVGDDGGGVEEVGHSYSGNVLNTQKRALEPRA